MVKVRSAHEVAGSLDARMIELARTFPCLDKAVGIEPWQPCLLDQWAGGPAPGSGARAAARFVLSVWNPDTPWTSGPFKLHDALAVWDGRHHRAFLAWAERPWWP